MLLYSPEFWYFHTPGVTYSVCDQSILQLHTRSVPTCDQYHIPYICETVSSFPYYAAEKFSFSFFFFFFFTIMRQRSSHLWKTVFFRCDSVKFCCYHIEPVIKSIHTCDRNYTPGMTVSDFTKELDTNSLLLGWKSHCDFLSISLLY